MSGHLASVFGAGKGLDRLNGKSVGNLRDLASGIPTL